MDTPIVITSYLDSLHPIDGGMSMDLRFKNGLSVWVSRKDIPVIRTKNMLFSLTFTKVGNRTVAPYPTPYVMSITEITEKRESSMGHCGSTITRTKYSYDMSTSVGKLVTECKLPFESGTYYTLEIKQLED